MLSTDVVLTYSIDSNVGWQIAKWIEWITMTINRWTRCSRFEREIKRCIATGWGFRVVADSGEIQPRWTAIRSWQFYNFNSIICFWQILWISLKNQIKICSLKRKLLIIQGLFWKFCKFGTEIQMEVTKARFTQQKVIFK